MKGKRKILGIAVAIVTIISMSVSVFAEGNPSASTWWPPGGSLLEDEDYTSNEIVEDDKNKLGEGFLGTYEDCLSQGGIAYKQMGDKIAVAIKDSGYQLPTNSRVNPVGAFKVTPVQGSTGPYTLKVAFTEVEMPPVGDQPTYGTILDMLSPSVSGQKTNVYALHYTGGQQKWEVLSSPILLSELNHDNMRVAYGTIKTNSLSPFYFFVVTNQLGTQSVQLEKAQPVLPQDKPVAPSAGMPKVSHKTGY